MTLESILSLPHDGYSRSSPLLSNSTLTSTPLSVDGFASWFPEKIEIVQHEIPQLPASLLQMCLCPHPYIPPPPSESRGVLLVWRPESLHLCPDSRTLDPSRVLWVFAPPTFMSLCLSGSFHVQAPHHQKMKRNKTKPVVAHPPACLRSLTPKCSASDVGQV